MENTFTQDMEKIINEADLPTMSSKLMERIRRKCVFLRNEYFRSFFSSDTVTIDPESECVKFTLGKQDLLENYVKIYAYSFGPFNPEKYFEEDTFRILWLLKEPYMKSGDLDQYKSGKYRYLGGFNQADDFKYFKDLESDTHKNLVRITQTILKEIQSISEEKLNNLDNFPIKDRILKLKKEKLDNENKDKNNVMSHICILEANHFPGLAFNSSKSTKSNDGLIRKWAEKNAMILKELIDFYKPNILIGGNTIGHFYNISDHSINSLKKSVENGNKELLSSIGLSVANVKKPDNSKNYHLQASALCKQSLGKEEMVYVIDAYHPCPKLNKNYEYTLEDAKEDAKQIIEWITK